MGFFQSYNIELYPTPINRNDWNFRVKEQNNRKYEGEMRTREEKFVDLWHPILQETGGRRQTKSAGPNCQIIDFETIRHMIDGKLQCN